MAGAAAVTVALIGGTYVMAQSDVATAQEGLDAANAQASTLATQVASYAEVPKVFAEVSAAQAQMVAAMGNEVRWSYLLNNLSLTIPKNVALVSYKGQLTPADSAPVAAPAATADGQPAPAPVAEVGPLGTLQYQGEAHELRGDRQLARLAGQAADLLRQLPQRGNAQGQHRRHAHGHRVLDHGEPHRQGAVPSLRRDGQLT